MAIALEESGQMISLEDGSPEGSAEFVTWVLNRFPPPEDVTVQLLSGATTQESPRAPPSKTCSPSALDNRSISPSPERCRLLPC
jgi:hypothetical protein